MSLPLTVGVGKQITGVVKFCSELKFYTRNGQEKPYFNFHVVTSEGALLRGVSFIPRFHDQLASATSVKIEDAEVKKSKFYAGQLEVVLQHGSSVHETPEVHGNFKFTKIKDLPYTPIANVRAIIVTPPSSSEKDTKTGNVTLHETTIRDETGIIPLVKWGGSFEGKVGDAAEIMHASPTKYQNKLQLTMSKESTLKLNSSKDLEELGSWYSQLSEDNEAPLDVSIMDLATPEQHFFDEAIVKEIEGDLALLEKKKKRLVMELVYHRSLPKKTKL